MDYLESAVGILCFGTTDSPRKVRMVLEDAESPVTKKTIENLYQSVIDKGHIDFDDIPKSKGNIVAYSGYKTMIQVLANLKDFDSFITDLLLLNHIESEGSTKNETTRIVWRIEQGNPIDGGINNGCYINGGQYPECTNPDEMIRIISPYYYCNENHILKGVLEIWILSTLQNQNIQ